MHSVGRNDPCPCGSGKKSKHCCGNPAAPQRHATQTATPASLSALLERAVQHHQLGQIDTAQNLYRQVLQINPQHPDALHLLGVSAAQAGDFAQSAQLIERAIKKNPRNPVFHNNLGNAYQKMPGQQARSLACYRSAIQLDPGYADAYNNLGNGLKSQGKLKEAIASYQAALARNPAQLSTALALANTQQKLGQHEQAVAVFRQLLKADPACAQAHSDLGLSLLQLGKFEDAEQTLLAALRLDDKLANAYFTLGMVLRAQERHAPAAESFSVSLKLNPNQAEAFYQLGLALQANELHQVAEQAFQKALHLEPGNPSMLLAQAEVQAMQGNMEAAIASCHKVIASNPDFAPAHAALGSHLLRTGEHQQALSAFKTAAALGMNTPSTLHILSALEGLTPKSASAEYITEVFDGYAAKFDSHLVDGLQYDSPRHLLDLALLHGKLPEQAWRLLDLGCGTGLCGVTFAPHSSVMVGVDLSSRMLDKARERGIYQRLVQSDLLTMMQAEPAASYDIVISADVFVYIGDLAEIYAESRRLLAPGGLFLFSVESSDALLSKDQLAPASDYQLLHSGRYAHAASYLQSLATDCNLRVLALESKVLRMENKAPIIGWCVVLAV